MIILKENKQKCINCDKEYGKSHMTKDNRCYKCLSLKKKLNEKYGVKKKIVKTKDENRKEWLKEMKKWKSS